MLFPLDTLDKLRDVAWTRGEALASTHGWEPRKVRKVRRQALEQTRMQALTAAGASGASGNATARRGSASVAGNAIGRGSVTARPGSPGNATDDRQHAPEADAAASAATMPPDATASATGQPYNASDDTVTPFRGSASGNVSRECEQCGKVFIPLRRTARYCGSNCRTAACRARKEQAS